MPAPDANLGARPEKTVQKAKADVRNACSTVPPEAMSPSSGTQRERGSWPVTCSGAGPPRSIDVKVDLRPKPHRALYPTDILFQTPYWGTFKSLLGWKPYAFEIETATPGRDVLVIVKSIGAGALAAFVPKGPELAPHPEKYGSFLESLSESMALRLGDSRIAFIRYDLPWESVYASELGRRPWQDQPTSTAREMRMNFGTRLWNLRKAPTDLTVADSCVVDLEASETVLLARMRPKTRYNIRLAERRGVRVDVAPLRELPAFYALYLETARRHGFPARDFQYFEALFAAQAAERDSSEVSLLIATHGGEAVAGALLATSTRGALYLHGASTYERRALMAPYLTHWRAMQYARARGCRTYDLGAVAPGDDPDHSFHGLYRFKTGFGGRLTHDSGSWDFPVDPEVYEAFRNWETTLPQRELLEGPAARAWPGSAYGSSLF